MNKLTIMSVTVAFTLGVMARDVCFSEDFEQAEIGEITVEGLNQLQSKGTPWSGAENSELAIKSGGDGKVLEVKTAPGKPLRLANAAEVSVVTYVNSKLRFQPCENGAHPLIPDDAKIAIWARIEPSEDGSSTTNLMVTAGQDRKDVIVKRDLELSRFYQVVMELVSENEGSVRGIRISLDGEPLEYEEGKALFPCLLENTAAGYQALNICGRGELDEVALEKPVLPTAGVAGTAVQGLDVAATYSLTSEGIGYDGWNADFLVSFDRDVEADAVTLGGRYDAWEGGSFVMLNPTPAFRKDEPQGVLAILGQQLGVDGAVKVSVNDLASVVKNFTCGVKNNSVAADLGVTVQLLITDGSTTNFIGEAFTSTIPAVKAWPETWTEDADQEVKEAFADWKTANPAADLATEVAKQAFLLNLAPVEVSEQPLTIESIAVGNAGATVVISSDCAKLDRINGKLFVEAGESLDGMSDKPFVFTIDKDGKATGTVGAKFIRAKIGFKAPVIE